MVEPLVMEAELSEPGGSLRIISGISGPEVSKVVPPLDLDPRITPLG